MALLNIIMTNRDYSSEHEKLDLSVSITQNSIVFVQPDKSLRLQVNILH